GHRVEGTIIAAGRGWDRTRAEGCTDGEAGYMVRADEGGVINVINVGALCPPRDGQPSVVRRQPRFEAPIGKYDWLNRAAFIGTLDLARDAGGPAVRIRFYKAM